MNTKVEEALGVLADAVRYEQKSLDPSEVWISELSQARTTLAAHIAQQDATIARLTELVRAVKSSDYEISCDDVSTGNWFDARAALNQGEVK